MRPTVELSSEREFEDFLRRVLRSPVRVMLERLVIPAEVVAVRVYEAETVRLRDGLEAAEAARTKEESND